MAPLKNYLPSYVNSSRADLFRNYRRQWYGPRIKSLFYELSMLSCLSRMRAPIFEEDVMLTEPTISSEELPQLGINMEHVRPLKPEYC